MNLHKNLQPIHHQAISKNFVPPDCWQFDNYIYQVFESLKTLKSSLRENSVEIANSNSNNISYLKDFNVLKHVRVLVFHLGNFLSGVVHNC